MPEVVEAAAGLPGKPGFRIASVANLLPPKDPLNLLRAMQIVARASPDAHLLMVGRKGDNGYMKLLLAEATDPILRDRVSFLGVRSDVPAILKACDIGVLSSASEGFPLALVEYGLARLPAVATRVGQCEEILDGGRVGLLVPPSTPDELARALLLLLESSARRTELGAGFRRHIRQTYSPERIMQQMSGIYKSVINPSNGAG
jgi:glycosyltransferase involved in cell wall biosynthesis